jgi:hypothetical protein
VLVRRVVGVVVALACVALLASCSLVPPGSAGGEGQHADLQMQHIADAVKSHDAAALKKLFSPRAREKATDLDSGLAYFLSVLPSGRMTWKMENGAPGSSEVNHDGYTEEVFANYIVSTSGRKYELYFADLTVNTNDPKNVGIYALGVEPYTADKFTASGAPKPFYVWTGQFDVDDNNVVTGTPGVYVPQK